MTIFEAQGWIALILLNLVVLQLGRLVACEMPLMTSVEYHREANRNATIRAVIITLGMVLAWWVRRHG